MVHHSQVSKPLRVLQVGCAIFWCLLVAGPSFGFAALKPVLVSEGVYQQYCTPDEIESGVLVCKDQDIRLNLVFTIAAVLTNVTAIVVGPTLDRFGPRVCGVIGALLIIVACMVLRAAATTSLFDGYIVGYTLLALGGPFTFISSFQLSNTFPSSSGLILALLTGAFDASSAVFLCYRLAYEKSGGTFHLADFFSYFLAVPVFILLVQAFVMPHDSYADMCELQMEAMDVEDGELPSETSTIINESTGLLARRSDITYTEEVGETGADASSPKHLMIPQTEEEFLNASPTEQMARNSGIWGVMHGVPVLEQLQTPWFYLMAAFTTIQMLRINYFVATVFSQYVYLLGSFDAAQSLNHFFDIALPVGGILAIPIIGTVLDNLSTFTVLSLLLSVSTCIGVFGTIPHSVLAAYLHIVLLVVYRPFYYTAVSDYAAKVFGFETFGTVYGVIICTSGIFNLVQASLDHVTHEVFKGNPIPVNAMLTAATVVIGGALLGYISTQVKHIRRKQLEDEAVQAPVVHMP